MVNKETIEAAFDLFDQGEIDESIKAFKLIETEIQQDDPLYDQFLLSYGYALSANDQMDEARNVYQTLLSNAKNPSDTHVAYHQLGMLERLDSEYDKALEYFEAERKIIDEHFKDEPMLHAVNLYEVGYSHMLLGKYDEATSLLEASLTYAKQSKDDMTIGCSYRALGELSAVHEEMDKAKTYFKEAKSHFKAVDEYQGIEEIEMLESVIFE